MTLDQIKTFVAIAHHGSVRKAARALGKSQPALTATVKSLGSFSWLRAVY
ncbi:LysR family transcriptional regulator [Vibrio sp. McD22-P3]|nr:LysR family transcriptional regulator [Vibrio sp. McD22-P3]MCF4175464.1 LysR family transcriptional regulator [Vibrio sp. McD22-P3]